MTISSPHDRLKYYLGRVIDTLSEEIGIEIVGQGQTTISRVDLDRGFERLEEKLGACGADVRRIKGEGPAESED